MWNLDELLERAATGDAKAIELLLASQRDHLVRFVSGRIDPRLARRIDPVDVVQDVLLEAACRIENYLETRPMPFPNWLMQIASDRIKEVHRRHFAKRRDVNRETPPPPTRDVGSHNGEHPEVFARDRSPSSHASSKELEEKVRQLISRLSEQDREILQLRFLEQRSVQEISVILKLTDDGVRMRQLRAVQRLRELLSHGGGGSRS